MKAAFLTGIRGIEIREINEPVIQKPTDVLLQVETVGVCGSDMHYYRAGQIPSQVVEFPWLIGHELSARVAQLGPEATGLAVGQRVAVDPLVACGTCDQCRTGRAHTCRNQAFLGCPGQLPGCMTQYVVMPASCCYPVPPGFSAIRTALTEPFAIGLYAQRLGGEPAGRTIAVLGSGPIGLCVLTALKAAGPCTVYATDIRDYRLAKASEMGADWTGNPNSRGVVADILAAEPLGVDLVYECAGEQETFDQAVELLKPGGVLLVVGIPETDRIGLLMAPMRRKELFLQNVRRQNECEADAIELLASGRANLDAMVTHEFSLDETQLAYDTVADYRDGAVKAMVHVS